MTEREFRARVKATYPHVKVSVKTVSFADLGFGSAKRLSVDGDRSVEELRQINELAKGAGIVPDGNARFYGEG